MSKENVSLRIVCAILILAGGVRPIHAMGGGGPPGRAKMLNYCRQIVASKGITDIAKSEEEVKKCYADLVAYPPADSKLRW